MLGKLAFEVGDGSRVIFWKDKWCGSVPLCEAFPNHIAVAAHKDPLIKDMWNLDEGGEYWNPLFLRPFNDWESEDVHNFLLCLSRKKVQPNCEDNVVWVEGKNGNFSVKSLFKALDYAPCLFSSKRHLASQDST